MYSVFLDDFNDTDIDRDEWEPKFIHRGIGEMIDSTLTYNVNNGKLELTMAHVPNYNANSDYVGQEFWTKDSFLYGSFECEATFATDLGSWPAFWSFHDGCIDGAGPEIDFAEYNSYKASIISPNSPFTRIGHYIHRWLCNNGGDDHVEGDPYSFTASTNTYKCVWTPEKIDFYVDNALKTTYTNNGQNWYPEVPVNVILSQQILQPYYFYNNEIALVDPVCPQISYFDYVNIKQFFLAPEITCPDYVCSSGDTASLDVDELASNITWELSPSGSFTNSSGSGETATITPKYSTSSFEGTLTYSFEMPSGETFTAEDDFFVNPPPYQDTEFELYDGYYNPISPYTDLEPSTVYEIYLRYDNTTGCSLSNYDFNLPSNFILLYDMGIGVRFRTPSTENYYYITADAQTCCGYQEVQSGYIAVFASGMYSMTLSPNPSSGETVVTLANEDGDFDETQEWDVEVYDRGQTLKTKKEKLKGNKLTLNISGWKEGIYFVRAKINGEVIYSKLVVN